jgi:hypothetical protein
MGTHGRLPNPIVSKCRHRVFQIDLARAQRRIRNASQPGDYDQVDTGQHDKKPHSPWFAGDQKGLGR